MCVHVCVCPDVCLGVYIYVCVCECVSVCVHVCTRVRMCVYVSVCGPHLGRWLTSMSHGLSLLSTMMSKPRISKHLHRNGHRTGAKESVNGSPAQGYRGTGVKVICNIETLDFEVSGCDKIKMENMPRT